MNKDILDSDVQEYIKDHLNDDVHKLAMSKNPFKHVSAMELAGQIAAKQKSAKKLPSWYNCDFIYYPALLSIEQCSSETTAAYKSRLAVGDNLADLTGGFGVDTYYFAKAAGRVVHCEINTGLSEIAAHNAGVMGRNNIRFITGDGLLYLQNTAEQFDTIYIDPARRGNSGKVFMLKDCTPNVVENMGLLLSLSKRVIIKTAPLLDISAGLKELQQVSAIHIVSVKNECKELIWVLDAGYTGKLKIVAAALNEAEKEFSFFKGEEETDAEILETTPSAYLYEPDAALLKSGAFNLIGLKYGLKKLQGQTHLYHSLTADHSFPGRIFKISRIISANALKKEKQLTANVIARNYHDKAENLVKKYRIKPDQQRFLIFTQSKADGYLVIEAAIVQHY